MNRPSRSKIVFQRLCLFIVSSFALLACSALQTRSPEHPQGGSLGGKPPSSLSDEDFSRSVLDGSDRPGASPLDLLKNPQVQRELQLTEAQTAQLKQIEERLRGRSQQIPKRNLGVLDVDQREKKLKELSDQLQEQSQASQKEVAGILQPEQLKRLKEITLQLYGWGILTSSQFNQELRITPEQQQEFIKLHQQMLRLISENWPTPAKEATPEAKQAEREVFRQNMDRITRQTNQQALAVLTPEQQKTLETLKGRKFELDSSHLPSGPEAMPSGQPAPGQ